MPPDPDPEWWSQKGKNSKPRLTTAELLSGWRGLRFPLHSYSGSAIQHQLKPGLTDGFEAGSKEQHAQVFSLVKRPGLSVQMVTKPSSISSWSGNILTFLRRLINQAYNVDAGHAKQQCSGRQDGVNECVALVLTATALSVINLCLQLG